MQEPLDRTSPRREDKGPAAAPVSVMLSDDKTTLEIDPEIFRCSLWKEVPKLLAGGAPSIAAFIREHLDGETRDDELCAVVNERCAVLPRHAPAILAELKPSDSEWALLLGLDPLGPFSPSSALHEHMKYRLLYFLDCAKVMLDSPCTPEVKEKWTEAIQVHAGYALRDLQFWHESGQTEVANPVEWVKDALVRFVLEHDAFRPAAKVLLGRWDELIELPSSYEREHDEFYLERPAPADWDAGFDGASVAERSAVQLENFRQVARYENAMTPPSPGHEWYHGPEALSKLLEARSVYINCGLAPFYDSATDKLIHGLVRAAVEKGAGCAFVGYQWLSPFLENDRDRKTAEVFTESLNAFLDPARNRGSQSVELSTGFRTSSDDPAVGAALEFFGMLRELCRSQKARFCLAPSYGELLQASPERGRMLVIDISADPSDKLADLASPPAIFSIHQTVPLDCARLTPQGELSAKALYQAAAYNVAEKQHCGELSTGFLSRERFEQIEGQLGMAGLGGEFSGYPYRFLCLSIGRRDRLTDGVLFLHKGTPSDESEATPVEVEPNTVLV